MGLRVGEMPCLSPECTCTDVAVEKTAADTLQAKCHKCGCPTFGKVGTKWRRVMEGLIKADTDSAAPSAAPTPPAARNQARTLLG
jgi:hypothetical protein